MMPGVNESFKMRKTIDLLPCVLVLTSVMAFAEGTATLRWPAGRYGLPNTIYGCPNVEGFVWDTGNITQALGPNSKTSNSFHLKARVNKNGVKRSFCIKNTDSLDPARPAWPAGRYCIYRKGRTCPAGLKAGSLMWNNRFDLSYTKTTGVVPDGRSTSSNTLINFCCAVNGNKNTPIPLPLESPFVLLAFQYAACQAVQGTLHRAEFIYYNTDGQNKLTSPHPYGAGLYSMNITYCYYQVVHEKTHEYGYNSNKESYSQGNDTWSEMGKHYAQACRNNLTALNGTIMSPFYPSKYPSNADCRWRIIVPVGYAITLEFEDVDMEPSDSCAKDWLQVSTGIPESVFSKYCTKRSYPVFEARSNVVVLDFHSDGVSSLNKGFRIHYRAKQVPVSLTTTSQSTVTTTTRPTTTTSAPRQTTAEPKPDQSTDSTSPTTQQSTIMTTEGSEGLGTMSRPSSPATPGIRGARKEDSGQRVWVIPVVVSLSILVVAVLLVVLYFKCLKKRNNIRRRHSTVKYDRRCSYVDMDIQSDAAFGIRRNPNAEAPILYDNYPGDEGGYSEPKPREAVQGPVYEEIKDPVCNEKGQKNNIYESMTAMNNYDTPQRTSRAAHVYESATLPLKK